MRHELAIDDGLSEHPVDLSIQPALTGRNRLTCAFRVILALPHLILVGGPVALAISFVVGPDPERDMEWGGGGGVLGVGVMMIAIISWFAIVFTGRMPRGLWDLVAFYMRWRVRAAAYVALLRDEFPPFGEGTYPVQLELPAYPDSRDRVSVAFRVLLGLPHLVMIWLLGIAWALTTMFAWFAIVFTGNYPRSLYAFAIGVLRWSSRVESYLLLLHDEYPPFSLA
jgi:hypothetical protein